MEEHIKYAASWWPTIFGLCRTQKKILSRSYVKAGRWDLVPKPTILLRTTTYDLEERFDMTIFTLHQDATNSLLKRSSRSFGMP